LLRFRPAPLGGIHFAGLPLAGRCLCYRQKGEEVVPATPGDLAQPEVGRDAIRDQPSRVLAVALVERDGFPARETKDRLENCFRYHLDPLSLKRLSRIRYVRVSARNHVEVALSPGNPLRGTFDSVKC